MSVVTKQDGAGYKPVPAKSASTGQGPVVKPSTVWQAAPKQLGPVNAPDPYAVYRHDPATDNARAIAEQTAQANADFAAMYGSQGAGATPSPYGSGGSGGGGSRSGGGGGGAAASTFDPAALDRLLALVNGSVTADRASAKSAYDGLDKYMAGLSDPYAHIQPAAQAQVDPSQFAALLQSQGVGDAGLRAQAQFLQAQNGSSAAAGDRLAQLMSANQQSWNQGSRTAGKLAAQQTDADLLSQLQALQAQIETRKALGK